jgi:hypothetical protein
MFAMHRNTQTFDGICMHLCSGCTLWRPLTISPQITCWAMVCINPNCNRIWSLCYSISSQMHSSFCAYTTSGRCIHPCAYTTSGSNKCSAGRECTVHVNIVLEDGFQLVLHHAWLALPHNLSQEHVCVCVYRCMINIYVSRERVKKYIETQEKAFWWYHEVLQVREGVGWR